MRDVDAAQIAEFYPFELFPQALARIELRRIGREPLQVHPLGRATRQELLDNLTAMNGGAIPDDDHAAGHLAEERLQKGDDISRVHRVILRMEVEFALGRDGADRRQMVTGI